MRNRVKEIIRKPLQIFGTLGHYGLLNWISDETYLKIAFYICMGKKLNLDNPRTYSEKLQWLKLNNRKPEYINMVDKYEAKIIAQRIIGSKYIIPALGIWDSFDEIEFDTLPQQFVLKCTHDSGGICICKDKNQFDIKTARQKINRCLKRNFYDGGREWPYKAVKPRIVAEQYIEDNATQELRDYKYFTFDGKAKFLLIATNRMGKEGVKTDFFDMEFRHLPFTCGHPNADLLPEKPKNFELMIQLAEKLAQGHPHLRVDFYEANGKVYFGEYTFFHMSGFYPYSPFYWDEKLGSYLNLPESIKKV